MIDELRSAIMRQSSILAVLADLGPIHGLNLTILDPNVISTIDDPWGAHMYRTSTLAILAYSGLFHGLLVTILGSQSDFHG